MIWLSTLARLVLAGVFLAAGAAKVTDPQGAVQAVRAYRLLPEGLARVVGWGQPFLEIAVGLLLAVGLFTRAVAIFATVLLAVFIAAVISVAARGLTIDCGCFGGGGQVAAGQTRYGTEVARDLGLLVAACWLVWKPHTRFSLDRLYRADR